MKAETLKTLFFKIKNKRFRGYILRKIAQKEKGYAYSKTIREIYNKEYRLQIGYGSYGGCFDIDKMPWGEVRFGNWCSIAGQVYVFRANHPFNAFTMHPILYNPVMGYVREDMLERKILEVGHDVWIGQNVIILPNVTKIGNGAVIGAGSVVTKNVESYTIVAGNPAKPLKKRFTDEQILKIEKSAWWNCEFDELVSKFDDLNALLD